jgi:hypothetical protein
MNCITCALLVLGVFSTLAICASRQQYHGILINGPAGTQLYDPFNKPHILGNLSLHLQTFDGAQYGSAANNGQLAFFGGSGGRCDKNE